MRRTGETRKRRTGEIDAALERWPAMKSGPSIINLDDSDNEEMDETAAKLAAVAEEPRVEGMVKVEPADSLLPCMLQCRNNPASQVVELDSSVEVKGPVAHLKCQRQTKLTSFQKQKDELEVLIESQALLVEMIRKIQRQDEEMKKSLLDLRSEKLSLSKFAPRQCRKIRPTTSGVSKTDSSDTPPVALPLN